MLDILKNDIFTTQGRLNRLRFLKYNLLLIFAGFIIFAICGLIEGPENLENSKLAYVLSIPISVAQIMIQIRRLHDLNKSGYFVLLAFIPVVNLLFELYLLFTKGTDGTNIYGYDPLLRDD